MWIINLLSVYASQTKKKIWYMEDSCKFRSNTAAGASTTKNRQYKKEKKVVAYIIHRHISSQVMYSVLCTIMCACECVCVCEKTDRSTSRAYSVAAQTFHPIYSKHLSRRIIGLQRILSILYNKMENGMGITKKKGNESNAETILTIFLLM